MRLARPAAAGLGIGVLAGFSAALLKPRRPPLPAQPSAPPVSGVPERHPRSSGDTAGGRDSFNGAFDGGERPVDAAAAGERSHGRHGRVD